MGKKEVLPFYTFTTTSVDRLAQPYPRMRTNMRFLEEGCNNICRLAGTTLYTTTSLLSITELYATKLNPLETFTHTHIYIHISIYTYLSRGVLCFSVLFCCGSGGSGEIETDQSPVVCFFFFKQRVWLPFGAQNICKERGRSGQQGSPDVPFNSCSLLVVPTKTLRVDSPFFPTIVLFENRPIPWVSAVFLEKRIPGKNGEGSTGKTATFGGSKKGNGTGEPRPELRASSSCRAAKSLF